jgi:predicted glycosyltransferase
MRIVIDILTPKQCMFLSRLTESLERRGHQVSKTTRKYREVNDLLTLKGTEATIVGGHGGGTLVGKLRANAQRILALTRIIDELKPDMAISFSSPEMARVAFGLGIPHICISDSPHAEAVSKLTIPLSKILFTPKVIPKRVWVKYGIPPQDILQYKALDPWAWLKDFTPEKEVLKQLNLETSKPILTFRTEESLAAYLLGRTKGISIIPVVEKLIKKQEDYQIVIMPRYKEQIKSLKKTFKDKVTVCESTIDGASLLYYTTIFIGAGGTMSVEAALLGVPTLSCYPGDPYLIEKYLMKEGLVVRERKPERIVNMILNMLRKIEDVKTRYAERAHRLVEGFEDPISFITGKIERL